MTVINSIEINNFRGIKQLTVSDFSKINLIVGDNNSGKTTFLESIQLLFAKPQLSYVRNVINQRTVGTFFSVRYPKNAMPSFGTFVSKIDWSKSDSLRELFRPFEHLGTERIYAL